jgi:predicted Zn-dependent protease
MRKLKWLPLLIAALCTGLAGAQEKGVRLPDIGSSAASAYSPEEMKAYGASMLHELRSYNLIFDDPLVSDYLQSLGYRLVSFSDGANQSFTFFVVRSNEINAFAAPGGYLGFNIGLINAVDSEDELAAVVGHEIAHITQQHLLRAFEDSKKSSLPIALAMIGALVASRNRSDDAGQAAIMGGLSLIQQRAINFTRYDEIEADRIGIQTLARAGYDPLAMADTFSMFQRIMRTNGVDIPEFLRTHPVDVNRIADAKARAGQLARKYPQQTSSENGATSTLNQQVAASTPLILSIPKVPLGNPRAVVNNHPSGTNYFELMRERARTLNADSANAIVRYYADEIARDPANNTPANRYGHALALVRVRQPNAAIAEYEKLLADFPGHSVFELGMAEAEDQSGKKALALKRYERLNTDYPGNRAISLAYADALLASGEKDSAIRAQDLLRPLLARYTEDPDLQRSFARANELAGDKVRAAEAYAEVAYLNGRSEDALNQLKALAKKDDLTYYQRARVDARITALTNVVLDLRKRGSRESDSDQKGGITQGFGCRHNPCLEVSSRRNNSPLQ